MGRVYLETFGCTLNRYDSEVMESYLRTAGYEVVDRVEDSDVVVINTCGVKKQTEDKMVSHIRKLRERYGDKKIVLTGCLTMINLPRLKRECSFDAVLGPSPGKYVVEAVEAVLRGEDYIRLNTESLDIPLNIGGSVTKSIGVSTGCLDNCAFCGTKLARGTVKSLEPEKVLRLVESYVKNGAKEILLTSVDIGAYGFDLRPRVPITKLLRMISEVEGNFIVRIGMMNPRWAYLYLDELIEIFESSTKFYHFLHIPVQTGSPELLRIMDRGHGVEEYLEAVRRLRMEVGRHFSIMTDIIVGHPGEREVDHEMTIEVLRESEPDFVNISQFFPRPGTKAARMKKVDTRVVKRRSREVSRVADEVLSRRNQMWRDWEGPVLINEFGRGRYLGRNYAYKIFAVDGGVSIGDVVLVRGVRAYTTWLYAELLGRASSLSDGLLQFGRVS